MNKLFALLGAAVLTVCAACGRPAKTASPTPQKPANYSLGASINPSTAAIDPILGPCASWTDVKVPLSLKLRQPASLSGSAQLTMVRAKAIHLSVRAIGFEVASLMITPDSVFAAEKIHKYWFAESTTQLLRNFPASISDLQDLLLGKVFLPGAYTEEAFQLVELKQEGAEGLCLLNPSLAVPNLDCHFLLQLGGTPSLLGFTASGGRSDVNIIYDDIESVSPQAGRVAGNLTVNALLGEKSLDATLTLKLDKAKWNQGASPSWKHPKGYTRITAAQLLNSLSKL